MGDLSSLKVTRLLLAALLLTCLVRSTRATLNIKGMSMTASDHTMGIVMGKGKKSSHDDDDDDDDDDCEEDKSPAPSSKADTCLDVKPSAWTLSNMYRDQPLFMNFRPRSEDAMLVDNVCFTFFPLPDDQFTYVMYSSTVYRDGSNLIESDIVTDVQLGVFRAANPYCTFKDFVLGYAGCDTFVMYRCFLNSECRSKVALFTYGLSQSCKQISISCLQKIEDIIEGNGIPEQDYVALPMKLPSECVFEPICTFKGDVHNQVGIFQGELVNPTKEVITIFEEPEVFVEEIIHPIPVIVEEIIHPAPSVIEEVLPVLEPVSRFYTYEGFSPANKYKPQPRPPAPLRPSYYSKPPAPRSPYGYR